MKPVQVLRQRRASEGAPVEASEAPVPEGPASVFGLRLPLSERWNKWVVRTITTWTLIAAFAYVVGQGPVAISVCIVALQLLAFREVVNIGYAWNQEQHLPLFRVQQWYFLFVALYWAYGKGTSLWLEPFLAGSAAYTWVVEHHSFMVFSGWVAGFVIFVISLRRGSLRYQLTQFALTHMALLLVIMPNQFVIANAFNGLFWFLLPSTLIFVNDITAYMWGFHFGRTPLIALSPKKTWEGFVGGGVCTLAWGFFFPPFLASAAWLVCPRAVSDCVINPVFLPARYALPSGWVGPALASVGFTVDGGAVILLPVQIIGVVLALFAALIAPFGGFFASGVKRAYKMKDFANLLPGHGGIIDRVDCQFLMAMFTYVVYVNFVNTGDVSVADLVLQLRRLSAGELAEVCAALDCPRAN